jgi:hypothetical protein|tara:strand:- start:75 stop:365 length:291 start_codon:yes stop_codon:yes gene_type:complete
VGWLARRIYWPRAGVAANRFFPSKYLPVNLGPCSRQQNQPEKKGPLLQRFTFYANTFAFFYGWQLLQAVEPSKKEMPHGMSTLRNSFPYWVIEIGL